MLIDDGVICVVYRRTRLKFKGWSVEAPGEKFREMELCSATLGQNHILVRISASGAKSA
jgi:hypothetical protein